jgi:hypothetical protein
MMMMMMMNPHHEIYISNNAKITIKNPMAGTITWKTKGKAKERSKDTHKNQRRERASPSCGRNNS